MIIIKKVSNIKLQIDTPDREYLKNLKDYFTTNVDGYYHMPKFKAGVWDGKISLFSDKARTLPYGLLIDWLKFHKKNYPEVPYQIDPEVSALFKGYSLIPRYDLSLYPYDYQKDCIEESLKHSRGILRIATASGKSLIISYVIKTLLENNVIKRCIIIVPTISLVEQFYDDMTNYGIKYDIGRVYGMYKEFESTIVVSTWQTLSNEHKKLKLYDGVIIDECLDGETLITTKNSRKKIKNIKKGDIIKSYNIYKKEVEYDIVEKRFENLKISSNEKMYRIKFDNGKEIEITGNHKFLTERGFIRADELSFDDNIISLKWIASRKGGIESQKLYGERLRKNLNTGPPWNKGKKGVQIPWNKGLTKETDKRLEKMSKDRTGKGNSMYGKEYPDKAKHILSRKMKDKILNGEFTPHIHNSRTHWTSRIGDKKFRSSWEAAFYILNPDFDYERIRLLYNFNGKTKVYLTDFSNDILKEVIEIKPLKHQNDKKFIIKIKSLKEWCENEGYTFFIIDERYFIEKWNDIDFSLLTERDRINLLKMRSNYENDRKKRNRET